jgi:hypothetical protein
MYPCETSACQRYRRTIGTSGDDQEDMMKAPVQIVVGFSLACVLLALAWTSLPIQATAGSLPPRPTLTPSPTLIPQTCNDDQEGGLIELRVPTSQITLWTVVQWQDTLGGWHTVQGWQGTLDEINAGGVGRKAWWVGKDEMGLRSFRWLVYQGPGGRLLATSRTFDLPRYNGEVVRVEVTLSD